MKKQEKEEEMYDDFHALVKKYKNGDILERGILKAFTYILAIESFKSAPKPDFVYFEMLETLLDAHKHFLLSKDEEKISVCR